MVCLRRAMVEEVSQRRIYAVTTTTAVITATVSHARNANGYRRIVRGAMIVSQRVHK